MKVLRILAAVAAAMTANAALGADPQPGGLVVHEWGVAIRHQTSNGPVLASPAELAADLPKFVAQQKSMQKLEPQGWNKPVIWIDGPEGTKVTVTVKTEKGFATASFPPGVLIERKFHHTDRAAQMISLLSEPAGYTWAGTLTREPAGKLPVVAKEHWWNTARAAGGMYFNDKTGTERFLFYEGTATTEPPVSAKVTADGVAVRNTHVAASGQVLVLANLGGKHHAQAIDTIAPRGSVTIKKDDLLKTAWDAEKVIAVCAAQWTGFGMTAAEGKAIAAVWRDDVLKPGRILLISRMPEKLYEEMFPLTVTPAPKEQVRVGLVIDPLEGQAGALDWRAGGGAATATEKAAAEAAGKIASGTFREREEAMAALEKLGASARGVVEELARSNDPEVSERGKALLKRIEPKTPTPTQEGTNEKGVIIRKW